MRNPGRTSGDSPHERGQSFVFARGVLRAELDQIRRRPFSMPSGWLVLALTALIAIAIVSGADRSTHGLARLPVPLVYVLGMLVGLAGSVGLMALAQLLEALGFRTARHAYLVRTAVGDSGAYIRGRDRLTLSSVWAWPRRTGLGAQVVQQACHDADQAQAPLWLIAANRGLVVYYQRFGFRRVRRVLMGHLMLRPPIAAGGGPAHRANPPATISEAMSQPVRSPRTRQLPRPVSSNLSTTNDLVQAWSGATGPAPPEDPSRTLTDSATCGRAQLGGSAFHKTDLEFQGSEVKARSSGG